MNLFYHPNFFLKYRTRLCPSHLRSSYRYHQRALWMMCRQNLWRRWSRYVLWSGRIVRAYPETCACELWKSDLQMMYCAWTWNNNDLKINTIKQKDRSFNQNLKYHLVISFHTDFAALEYQDSKGFEFWEK